MTIIITCFALYTASYFFNFCHAEFNCTAAISFLHLHVRDVAEFGEIGGIATIADGKTIYVSEVANKVIRKVVLK